MNIEQEMRLITLVDFIQQAGQAVHEEVTSKNSAWRQEHNHSQFIAYMVLKMAIDKGLVSIVGEEETEGQSEVETVPSGV